MDFGTVIYESKDQIATITLNHPEVRFLLSAEVILFLINHNPWQLPAKPKG